MRAEMKVCFTAKILFFKGVCVARPSALGPYPRPSTLDLLSLGHVVGPRPKILQKKIYE